MTDWLTKPQAAAALGISEKGVQRMAARGTIQSRQIKRDEDGVLITVYHPEDVARVAGKPAAPPFVVRDGPARPGPVPVVQDGRGTGAALALLEALSMPSRTLPVFLPIDQAVGYSGLSATTLRRFVRQGLLTAVRGRIARVDLDALPERLPRALIGTPRGKALAALQDLND